MTPGINAATRARPTSGWPCPDKPAFGELFFNDPGQDWCWEGLRAGGKLYLFCYQGEEVITLAPFDIG